MLSKLPEPVAKVAAHGIPAIGTRTRWTMLLIEKLAEVAPPAQVKALVQHWLRTRPHQSEDVEVARERALAHANRQLGSFYSSRVGVSERAWKIVDKAMRAHYASQTGAAVGAKLPPLPALMKTAFFLLMKFYSRETDQVPVSFSFLEQFTGANSAKEVHTFLEGAGWLQVGPYRPGVHARIFTLSAQLWPPLPFEPVLHLPP